MFVALDIATRCGWAAYEAGMSRPIYGTWALPGEAGEVGRKSIELHRKLTDLHSMAKDGITRLYFEGGIPTNSLGGKTNMQTIYLLAGLAAHAESFAYAVSARCRNVPQTSWRKHFVGRGIRKGIGLNYKQFKALSTSRCHELGWMPQDDNAADALAILDYALHLSEITTPWQDKSVFRGAIDG
jgi:hypothetical protein